MPSRTIKGCVNWETGKVEFETPYWASGDYEGEDVCLIELKGCVIWAEGEHQGQVKVEVEAIDLENQFCKLKARGNEWISSANFLSQQYLPLKPDAEFTIECDILCMHIVGPPVLPGGGRVEGCLVANVYQMGNLCYQEEEVSPHCATFSTLGHQEAQIISAPAGEFFLNFYMLGTAESTGGSDIENWDWVHFDNVSLYGPNVENEMGSWVVNGDFENGSANWMLGENSSIGNYFAAEGCDEDIYYACIDWVTGKFEVKIPDECFGVMS